MKGLQLSDFRFETGYLFHMNTFLLLILILKILQLQMKLADIHFHIFTDVDLYLKLHLGVLEVLIKVLLLLN